MRRARRFRSPEARQAAAVLCATVTDARHSDPCDLDALSARFLDRLEDPPLSPVDVALGASVVISKLAADGETVFGVPFEQTLARLGLWVATDELIEEEEGDDG